MFHNADDLDAYCVKHNIALKCVNCYYPCYPLDVMEQVKRRILPSYQCYNCDDIMYRYSFKSESRYYNCLDIAAKLLNCERNWRIVQHLNKEKWSW